MLSLPSPFARLRTLLHGTEPGKPAIDLSIGAPRHRAPHLDLSADSLKGLQSYPRIEGLIETRQAIADWLEHRFDAQPDPETEIAVTNGSREGLFYAALHAIALKRSKGCTNPVVGYPNPLYPVYGSASQLTGSENLPLFPTRGGHGLPDLKSIPEETLRRLACLYICSPSNPQGAVANEAWWQAALELARTYGFYLFADECYSEIYYCARPSGALNAAGTDFSRLVSFNSLSKRSSVPGLRFGFVAGDADFIIGLSALRNVCGPQTPEPVQRAAMSLLADESHVEANRALYGQKMKLAAQALQNFPGFRRPEGGFCLWLDVSTLASDEDFTRQLWQSEGIKVLPGSYLSETVDGINPGVGFVRIALVASLEETEEAMTRLSSFINKHSLRETA